MLFQNLRLWCCHLLTARWYMSSGSSLSATYMKIAYISGSAMSAKLIMSFKSASIIPCMHPRYISKLPWLCILYPRNFPQLSSGVFILHSVHRFIVAVITFVSCDGLVSFAASSAGYPVVFYGLGKCVLIYEHRG